MSAARGSSILAAAASCCDFAVKYRGIAMPMHMDAFSASGQALVEKSSFKDDASAPGQILIKDITNRICIALRPRAECR